MRHRQRAPQAGMPHSPICSLCRMHLETALHLVVNCSFARCVGTDCLLHFGLHFASPAPKEHNSDDWCFRSIGNTSKPAARKINCSDDLWSNVNSRGSILSIGPSRIQPPIRHHQCISWKNGIMEHHRRRWEPTNLPTDGHCRCAQARTSKCEEQRSADAYHGSFSYLMIQTLQTIFRAYTPLH